MTRRGRPLDDRYLDWLYKQIGLRTEKNPARSHFLLAEQMHKKPFRYFVPNDDNRAEDGKALRDEFLDQLSSYEFDEYWYDLDCSVLEMLIALSRRVAFEAYDVSSLNTPGDCFWQMMTNLELKRFVDDLYDINVYGHVDGTLEVLLNRTYKSNGDGGLFPLRRTRKDQRRVEIWYQMSAYLLENSSEGSRL